MGVLRLCSFWGSAHGFAPSHHPSPPRPARYGAVRRSLAPRRKSDPLRLALLPLFRCILVPGSGGARGLAVLVGCGCVPSMHRSPGSHCIRGNRGVALCVLASRWGFQPGLAVSRQIIRLPQGGKRGSIGGRLVGFFLWARWEEPPVASPFPRLAVSATGKVFSCAVTTAESFFFATSSTDCALRQEIA